MRKIMVFLLALMMVPQAVFAAFSDVGSSHWAYECIEEMQSLGVIDGYGDGSFRPEGLVSRAEIARMLCDIASLPEGTSVYSDVSENDWFYTYARDCGAYIEEGSRFYGTRYMTRQELASAIVLIKGIEAESDEAAKEFSDYEKFENPLHVAAAVKNGFISGYDDGSFKPLVPITRAEVCSMLQRAFEGFEQPEQPEEPEEAEGTWSVRKLANAELDSFRLNAMLDEDGKLIFIEPEEEEELLFEIDLPKGETQRETMWRLKRFLLKTDANIDAAGYTDFVPHSVFFDNSNTRIYLFGKFRLYTAPDGSTYEVNKYTVLDMTIRLEQYAGFEEGRVQYTDNDPDCIPQLLYIHNEKYTVTFDGKNSVHRFAVEDGIRHGELYSGKADTFRGFLSIGERMFGVDKAFNLVEYDFENLAWGETLKTFDADILGTRDNKFWLWDTEKGEIYTSTPDGKTATVHENVTLGSISADDGIGLSKLDGYMLVYDKNTFILYDGNAFLILEKKQ